MFVCIHIFAESRWHLGKKMKRKKMQKLFLFYVNINYRIFHVYNNLLLATIGVVDDDVVVAKLPSSNVADVVIICTELAAADSTATVVLLACPDGFDPVVVPLPEAPVLSSRSFFFT